MEEWMEKKSISIFVQILNNRPFCNKINFSQASNSISLFSHKKMNSFSWIYLFIYFLNGAENIRNHWDLCTETLCCRAMMPPSLCILELNILKHIECHMTAIALSFTLIDSVLLLPYDILWKLQVDKPPNRVRPSYNFFSPSETRESVIFVPTKKKRKESKQPNKMCVKKMTLASLPPPVNVSPFIRVSFIYLSQ